MDHTPSIRELLIHTLRSLVPYEIIAVTDATAALAMLAARPIPLLITDYHLSDMRGDELAAAAKAASPATSVLMITADVDATRYGAEIVAQTLDYQGANEEDEAPVATPATVASAPQPVALVAEAPAKPKRRRAKKSELAAA